MIKSLKIATFSFCFIFFVQGQITILPHDKTVLVLPQGHIFQQLDGSGLSSFYNDNISGFSGRNPASLSNIEKPTVGLSFQRDTKIKEAWITGISHKLHKNDLPQSFGILLPLENFALGYGFSQTYNSVFETSDIEIRTVEYPDGTGEYCKFFEKNNILSHFFIISYDFEFSSGILSIGGGYYDHYLEFQNGFSGSFTGFSASVDAHSENWQVGAQFAPKILDKYKLLLSLFYQSEANFHKLYSIANSFILDDIPDTISIDVSPIPTSFTYNLIGALPAKIHFGYLYHLSEKIKFGNDLSYVYWRNSKNSIKNQIEISGNFIYHLSEPITISTGFFATNYRFDDQNIVISEFKNKLKTIYLISGIVYNLGNVNLNLAIADSHLLSGDYRKQTILKVGIGYHF